jgi:hypothetical protein
MNHTDDIKSDNKNDIRDQAHLSGSEVKKLNFIKDSKGLVFRKYYRSGLRSHIFEVLLEKDVIGETQGRLIDGIRMFPRARPIKMFRILRTKFDSKEAVFLEIERYNSLLKFIGSDLIALSEEFMADYRGEGENRIVLCGLQEYVEGQVLDPWRLFGDNSLMDFFRSMPKSISDEGDQHIESVVQKAEKNVASFVKRIRRMIDRTGYIPDLAGIGNLILTPQGGFKLVDINNIVEIRHSDKIALDDKGYPSCDVSIEVLYILEKDILQRDIFINKDPLYRFFLSPERKKAVKVIENKFYETVFSRP